MKRVFVIALAMAVLGSLSSVLVAHHGGAAFDQDQTVTFRGTVTEMTFTNPHVSMLWEVTKDGATEKWSGWLTAPNKLARAGWTKVTLRPGRPDRGDGHATQGRQPHPAGPEARGARRQGASVVRELRRRGQMRQTMIRSAAAMAVAAAVTCVALGSARRGGAGAGRWNCGPRSRSVEAGANTRLDRRVDERSGAGGRQAIRQRRVDPGRAGAADAMGAGGKGEEQAEQLG